jgi:hypothetical protein
MKISTKFIGISVFLVSAIGLISGGTNLWRNQAEQTALKQYSNSKRQIELSTQAQSYLREDISRLKDSVLFKQQTAELDRTEKDTFIELMQTVNSLDPLPEVDWALQRYQVLMQLKQQLFPHRSLTLRYKSNHLHL